MIQFRVCLISNHASLDDIIILMGSLSFKLQLVHRKSNFPCLAQVHSLAELKVAIPVST